MVSDRPPHYSRVPTVFLTLTQGLSLPLTCLVGKVGFEPTQREAADLQSAVTLQLHRLPNKLILEVHSRNRTLHLEC